MERKSICNECQRELSLDSGGKAITPFKCRKTSYTVQIGLADTVNMSVKEPINLKVKDKNHPGKKKDRRELFQGYQKRGDGKSAVQKIRDINRDVGEGLHPICTSKGIAAARKTGKTPASPQRA